MARMLGIDLGTTNSAVAVMERNGPFIVPNSIGERLTPSVVGFTKAGDILVGKKAKRGAVMNIGRTVFSVKRHMGTGHRERVEGREYTPQEISAMILQRLKQDAEDYFGEEINDAVVTVPAYFTDTQRQATKDAGEIAGFNVRRVIDEPTAAALAYGLDKEEDQVLMVYDLGGGTFDVSIIEVTAGVFQVRAVSGDNELGGDDFDQRLVDHLLVQFKEEQGVDLSEDPIALQRLKEAAEEAKIELSELQETHILIEAVTMTEDGPLTVDASLTRAKFEELVSDLVERTIDPVNLALSDAEMTAQDIDKVLLVGGTTRMPMVQRQVKEITGREPQRDLSPEEVVALGAAVQTLVLIEPTDEGEGDAAARYGREKPVIIHMTPFSLGVGIQHDQFSTIIERNSTYPTEAKDIFTTTRDFQEAITFPIYEGEEQVASENPFLDILRIEGVTPAPRGVPRIEVTFRLNADRILEARAEDLATGVEKVVRIEATDNRLSDEDKIRMSAEAKRRSIRSLRGRMNETTNEGATVLLNRADTLLAGADDAELQSLADDLRGLVASGAEQSKIADGIDQLRRLVSEREAAG